MKHIILFVALLLSTSLVFGQKPSNEELQKTTENIQNLIKRDSLSNLIISELESKLDSIQTGLSGKDKPETVIKKKVLNKVEESVIHEEESQSIWAFVLIAFSGGLIALLTPCVFPMIPLTVTFFTSNSTNKGQAIRKALVYGFSIVFIYSVIGVFISATLGPSFATFMSVHWIPNLIFFLIFITFGLSFLGLFEITLPNSFVNRVDAQSEKGGYYGVFFMAFTLVLVSFSCTGPIVGSILVQAFQGEAIRPMMGMIAYATAFAIPFTIFAMFPQLLNRLPKSGGWLNVIKATLGFIELGLALKFLSMIDQVYHLSLLDREVYIAIWIAISLVLGYYLLGRFKLPLDSDLKVVSVPRLLMALVPFAFAVYLLPGMFGAPLKALSGYLPPMHTHDFDLPAIIRQQGGSSNTNEITLCDEPKYKGKFNLPHGLKGYFDYTQALACAKEKNLPLFLDFTGHGCVNCREVEANVWSDPRVLNKLKKDFIIVSLYVDDFTKLAKEEVYYSEESRVDIETIGERNFDLEQKMFGVTSQPFYAIIDPHTEKPLTTPIGYVSSPTVYLQFLEKALDTFINK
jgi:thiol:disulfide interchange protein